MKLNISELSDRDLEDLKTQINEEISRRAIIDTAPAVLKELNQKILQAEGNEFGAEWRQPKGAHNAYPEGWEVSYLGKKYVSSLSGNVWRPDVPGSGWVRK